VRQVGHLQELNRDARSTEHKILQGNTCQQYKANTIAVNLYPANVENMVSS